VEVILGKIIKKKTIKIIKTIGIDIFEIVIKMPISFIVFDSIEYVESTGKIILHYWEEDYDMNCDFDDLENEDKLKIYEILSKFL
jgi:hypothetical protein